MIEGRRFMLKISSDKKRKRRNPDSFHDFRCGSGEIYGVEMCAGIDSEILQSLDRIIHPIQKNRPERND